MEMKGSRKTSQMFPAVHIDKFAMKSYRLRAGG
jgi:hypothetical protein